MHKFKRVAACAAVVGGVAGCAAAGTTTPKVSGGTLTVYASDPAGTPADIIDAEWLAWGGGSHTIGSLSLKFVVLHRSASDNARTAIENSSAIAYIGEPEPGLSANSIGITNAQDLLQVSPADTALDLTRATPAVPGAPLSYYESHGTYGRTFARVVPTTAAEASAQVAEMQALGVKKVYVTHDSTPYGEALAYAVVHGVSAPLSAVEGPPQAARATASGADAVFFAGTSTKLATALFDGAGKVKLLAPSALYSSGFAQGLSATARPELYVSSPGFLSGPHAPAGPNGFVTRFSHKYGHVPIPAAIFGYEAVSAVLATLQQAGASVNQRTTVVRDFNRIRDRSSVIGTYSIDAFGDPTIAPFVFARVRGTALVPYRSVSVPGGT